MDVQRDIFSNKSHLKHINKNFDHFIQLIQATYTPLSLPHEERLLIKEISFEFLQEFNGSHENRQVQLLSSVQDTNQIWIFLSWNPTSYDCQAFIEELYQLASNALSIKQHLAFHSEDFLLTLGVSYDDNLRFGCFKLVAILINDAQPQSKGTIARLNRMCYECLYDFDVYYETINAFTIESRIFHLPKEDIYGLINEAIIRKDLEEKLLQAIHELGGFVFFKMHRSPKDAYEALCKEINGEWCTVWGLKCDEDPRLHFMKIQNINQLKLLFKTSDRLRQDLEEVSSNGNFVLRKWLDHIPDEYRCFVCNGKVNAVSGYGYNKEPMGNEEQLIEFLNSKPFQETILTIPYSHAVVDFSLDPTSYQVRIIEINPFGKRSSAAKFSWIIDKHILYYHNETNGNVNIKL